MSRSQRRDVRAPDRFGDVADDREAAAALGSSSDDDGGGDTGRGE